MYTNTRISILEPALSSLLSVPRFLMCYKMLLMFVIVSWFFSISRVFDDSVDSVAMNCHSRIHTYSCTDQMCM